MEGGGFGEGGEWEGEEGMMMSIWFWWLVLFCIEGPTLADMLCGYTSK